MRILRSGRSIVIYPNAKETRACVFIPLETAFRLLDSLGMDRQPSREIILSPGVSLHFADGYDLYRELSTALDGVERRGTRKRAPRALQKKTRRLIEGLRKPRAVRS